MIFYNEHIYIYICVKEERQKTANMLEPKSLLLEKMPALNKYQSRC